MEKAQKEQIEKAIVEISKSYGCSIENVSRLIELTNENGKAQFVVGTNYSSDKSGHTEVANFKMNIGIVYANVVEKSLIELHSPSNMIRAGFDVWAENWNYTNYNLVGIFLKFFPEFYDTIKNEKDAINLMELYLAERVGENFDEALYALQNPTKKDKEKSNDIWLNKALVFNTNTLRLCVFGLKIEKTIIEKGEFKKVVSAPLTIAKEIIRKVVAPKNAKLIKLAVDNLNGMNLQGEILEIGGGK